MLAAILACSALVVVATTQAHNAGYDVPSPGSPGAAINVDDGAEVGAEWAGAATFAMADYGMGNPLSASVKALHKADGIYLLAIIADNTNNNNDAIQIRFDLNHNGVIEATDWGAQILRPGIGIVNHQVNWGPANADPFTWVAAPAGTGAATSTGASWTIEMHLPTAPSGTFAGFSLSGGANCPAPALANGCIGIHLELFDTDQALGPNSAKYTQWPNPTAMDAQGFDTMFDVNANKWGNYSFDPATTFPNIAITGVRRGGGVGPENYYNISHTAVNTFVVRVKNPGGTAIADATGVRLNLYVGAVGLGEPFHRLDTAATIDGDCPAYNPAASLPQADVCSGAVSLPDIETISLANIVTNNAKYTVKNGTTRLGGTSIVVPGGTEPPGRPGFFRQHNPKLKCDHDDSRIDDQRRRVEEDRPPKQQKCDADVHRIARESVRAADDKMLRRSPRRQRAPARDVEFADTRQQQATSNKEYTGLDRRLRVRVSSGDQGKRRREGNHARQRQQCHKGLEHILSDEAALRDCASAP